jgi:hypothetical protein
MFSPTKITEGGLRETLKRLFRSTYSQPCCQHPNLNRVRSGDAYITRFDGKFLKLHVIRNTIPSFSPSEPRVNFEVMLSWNEDDESDEDYPLSPFKRAMDRMLGVDGCEVLAFLKEDFSSLNGIDPIPRILQSILRARDAELCPSCRDNMVTDGNLVCTTCTLGLSEQDCECHACGVCKEGCLAPIMLTACCKQYIHKVCWARCYPRMCPFCRDTEAMNS